jgi:hypothetical protein
MTAFIYSANMCTAIASPQQWAQLEFGTALLSDKRRTKRLVDVAAALAQCPSGTLPQAIPFWSGLKGAYRLFNNPEVTFEKICASHWQQTREACNQPGEYLLIEDTTVLDYSQHKRIRGMGRVGNDEGVGMMLHTTLVTRVEHWQLDQTPELSSVGILSQKCWTRQGPPLKKVQTRRQRLSRQRESQRWGEALSKLPRRGPGVSRIMIADREADIFETFQKCHAAEVDFIIRATCARALANEDQSTFEAVAAAPLRGTFEVELRARPDSPARVAKLELRMVSVELRGTWRPGGKTGPMEINVVEARETDVPAGAVPLRWVLLTSLDCERVVELRRIVERYARRWLVEDYHKALKTGAHIEQSQLEERTRIEALLGVLALVALRLLSTKLLARSRPNEPVNSAEFGEEAINILSARFGCPEGGWTHSKMLVAIARMGGFLARKGDGSPGWITIWRGWQRLTTMVEGVESLSRENAFIGATRCG